jgi:hypothetical protein
MLNLANAVNGVTFYQDYQFNSIKNNALDLVNSTGQTPVPDTGVPDTNVQQWSIGAAIHAAGGYFYVDSGAADAYVLGVQTISGTPMRAPNVYFNGMCCRFVAGNTNTGVSTVNVAGLGVKTLKKDGWTLDLEAGDIEAGEVYDIIYSTSTGFFKVVRLFSAGIIVAPPTAYVKDEKAYNVDGGTFTAGAWRTRVLNTLTGDTSFISLASNQITLDPGTYIIYAIAPSVDVDTSIIQLYNVTDTATVIVGSTASSQVTTNSSHSFLMGTFTIAASKTFEIQHQGQTTRATDGFGVQSSFAGYNSVYTQVTLTKIA